MRGLLCVGFTVFLFILSSICIASPDVGGPHALVTPTAPPPTAYVHGTVTDATTHAPIAGAFVVTNPWSFYATTNATGSYWILVGLASWPANVSVTASAALHEPQSVLVTLSPSTNVTVNFTLAPFPGWIAGTVTNASLAPISGCILVFRDAEGARTSLATDTAGRFNRSLPPGTYDVNASAPGYVSTNRSGVVVASNRTTSVSFQLNRTLSSGWLAGTVTGGGNTIPNATVRVFSGTVLLAVVRTDAAGRYNIRLLGGLYAVNVTAVGFLPTNATGLVVVGGATTQHDIQLMAVPSPPPAPLPFWLIGSGVILVVVGAVVLVVLLARGRRRP